MSSDIGITYLLGLAGFVAFGAVVPVVPTGAAVSVAAAVADRNPLILLLVVAFGAGGAYVGDIATYALLRFAGDPLRRHVRWLRTGDSAEALEAVHRRVEEHEIPVLLTSRLIPGGRIPVLFAVALGGYSWRRFAVADIAAASLWSAVYAAIGILGRAIFPEPWEAALAAIAIILLVTLANSAIGRWRARSSSDAPDATKADERAAG